MYQYSDTATSTSVPTDFTICTTEFGRLIESSSLNTTWNSADPDQTAPIDQHC